MKWLENWFSDQIHFYLSPTVLKLLENMNPDLKMLIQIQSLKDFTWKIRAELPKLQPFIETLVTYSANLQGNVGTNS